MAVSKSQQRVVPRQFIEDFETVAASYNLKETGEYEIAKQAARDDINSAMVCYHDMANEIRGAA